MPVRLEPMANESPKSANIRRQRPHYLDNALTTTRFTFRKKILKKVLTRSGTLN
jgi:hypothetical protein